MGYHERGSRDAVAQQVHVIPEALEPVTDDHRIQGRPGGHRCAAARGGSGLKGASITNQRRELDAPAPVNVNPLRLGGSRGAEARTLRLWRLGSRSATGVSRRPA